MCFLNKNTWGLSRNRKKPLFGVPCEHPLPLPLGEVAERSEDGEGKWGCHTLSVTFGDSSPKGGAKGACPVIYEKWSVSIPIRSINCFPTTY